MRLFRKRNKSSFKEAEWLAKCRDVVELRQRQFAEVLGRRTQYWNRGSWIIALALFVLLFGGACLLLCIKAFIHL